MRQNFFITLAIMLAIAPTCHAYLDPGSGSIMLQGLFAGVAGIIAVLKIYWQRIKLFIGKILGKNTDTVKNVNDDEQLN